MATKKKSNVLKVSGASWDDQENSALLSSAARRELSYLRRAKFGSKVERKVKNCEQVLDKIFYDLQKRHKYSLEEMVAIWRKCVGADLASESQPISLRGKTLTIGVSHPTLLSEFEHGLRDFILKKLTELSPTSIKKVRFVYRG